MRVLGVDPGASGALALLDGATLIVQDVPTVVVKRSRRVVEINDAGLARLVDELRPEVAWIEQVHAMPKQGVSSSFSFGASYGLIRGILIGKAIPYFLVTPHEWKREFRLSSDKQEARLLASRMFPEYAQTFSRTRDDGRAEAALLAAFGARHPL